MEKYNFSTMNILFDLPSANPNVYIWQNADYYDCKAKQNNNVCPKNEMDSHRLSALLEHSSKRIYILCSIVFLSKIHLLQVIKILKLKNINH